MCALFQDRLADWTHNFDFDIDFEECAMQLRVQLWSVTGQRKLKNLHDSLPGNV
jgi:hypothetical protein